MYQKGVVALVRQNRRRLLLVALSFVCLLGVLGGPSIAFSSLFGHSVVSAAASPAPPADHPIHDPAGRNQLHRSVHGDDDGNRVSVGSDERKGVNVVFSCFYATNSNRSFYHGRSVPTLDWIVVFLRSAHRQMHIRQSGNAERRPSMVVLFVDQRTYTALMTKLREFHATDELRVPMDGPPLHGGDGDGGGPFVRFVIVLAPGEEAYPDSRRVLQHEADRVVRPAYLVEPWAADLKNGANNFRFQLYATWIEARKKSTKTNDGEDGGGDASFDFSYGMFSDSTDVAFQRNPFAADSSDAAAVAAQGKSCIADSGPRHHRGADGKVVKQPVVFFTLENGRKTFSNEKYNKRWMSCYGDRVARHMLKGRPISCAGVTFGSLEGLRRYARAQLVQIKRPELVSCAINTIGAALDQATHNYLLHAESDLPQDNDSRDYFARSTHSHEQSACTFHGNFGKLNVEKIPQFKSSAEVGIGEVPDPVADDDRYVVDAEGRPYAVVHQYTSDRHPAVMKMMKDRYLMK